MGSLAGFVKKDKVVKFEYPEIPGFMVSLRYTGKTQLQEMVKACSEERMDLRAMKKVEEVNEIKFKKLIATKVLVGWQGLTIGGLKNIILLDEEELKSSGMTDETVVEASFENKMMLLDNSLEFDRWVNDIIHDLKKFRDNEFVKEVENLKS
jgi:hypothetical protein